MAWLDLMSNGEPVLVNMDHVAEVVDIDGKECDLQFSFDVPYGTTRGRRTLRVEHSRGTIYNMLRRIGESVAHPSDVQAR